MQISEGSIALCNICYQPIEYVKVALDGKDYYMWVHLTTTTHTARPEPKTITTSEELKAIE